MISHLMVGMMSMQGSVFCLLFFLMKLTPSSYFEIMI